MKKVLVLVLSICALASAASAEPFIVLVRHAEKAANDPKDPDLSPDGRVRSELLAKMVKDAGISAIFVTEFKRTQETAEPTAKISGVKPTIVGGKDTAGLLARFRELKGNALVVGHGNTIPDIIKALGIETLVR